jgi:hypothetical protein
MVDFPGELSDQEVGELWRRYRQSAGKDPSADLVLRLIRKLVRELAWNVPYGSADERLGHALKQFGISTDEWVTKLP